jgi:hypothetical protein
MAERSQAVRDQYSARVMSALQALLEDCHPRNFAIGLWDGATWNPEPGQFCRFTWHINHAGALRALLRSDQHVALGATFSATSIFLEIYSCAYFDSVHDSASDRSTTEACTRLTGLKPM